MAQKSLIFKCNQKLHCWLTSGILKPFQVTWSLQIVQQQQLTQNSFLSEAKSGLIKSTHLQICANVQAKYNSKKNQRQTQDIHIQQHISTRDNLTHIDLLINILLRIPIKSEQLCRWVQSHYLRFRFQVQFYCVQVGLKILEKCFRSISTSVRHACLCN